MTLTSRDERKITVYRTVYPQIYAYNTVGLQSNEGWTKIGYTEKEDVTKRIDEQLKTGQTPYKVCWHHPSVKEDGVTWFKDHAFHAYLRSKDVSRRPNTEWFETDGDTAEEYFYAFKNGTPERQEHSEYTLRREQQEAVDMTKAYFESGGREFLWNAKPRFGKTLTAYDLAVRMGCEKVLIVTNRPAVANSWADDFFKFIDGRDPALQPEYDYAFVSENDAIRDRPGVLSRDEYVNSPEFREADEGNEKKLIAFESLQGLKRSKYFGVGGKSDRLSWIANEYVNDRGIVDHGYEFDLLIVDESHEGVDTDKTDKVFRNIARKHTLYLSGTPFRALADGRFGESQIFNWTYADEQAAKEEWDSRNWAQDGGVPDHNPYEDMPRLAMFTYQMSEIIYDRAKKGIALSDDNTWDNYAFDLNEFFSTDEAGHFVHKDDVRKFLRALTTQEKYPYSTPKLREELSHTLWLLDRVDSAKALERMLKRDEVFKEYEIVLAAGDGVSLSEGEDAEGSEERAERIARSYDRVKKAIRKHRKTITLSVGQLTVGVTIPEWSAVLMLCNLKSSAAYMQAAFRAQNPYSVTRDGVTVRKTTSYLFVFDPARTLIIYDEFAERSITDRNACREDKIRTLLNFFPVIAEDEQGRMVELDAAQVLSVPRRVKCTEVVRTGFRSNFLFQNIGAIFSAPQAVRDVLGKLTPAPKETPKKKEKGKPLDEQIKEVHTDKDGNVDVGEIVIGRTPEVFGPKIYGEMKEGVKTIFAGGAAAPELSAPEIGAQRAAEVKEFLKERVIEQAIRKDSEDHKEEKRPPVKKERLEERLNKRIDEIANEAAKNYGDQKERAQAILEQKTAIAETQEEKDAAAEEYRESMQAADSDYMEELETGLTDVAADAPQEVIGNIETKREEKKKKTAEDTVRDHLRGFSRTIPSFLMAYGDDFSIRLRNFDTCVDDAVFTEVTGITLADFRLLRDGGDIEEDGEITHFDGHFFDEAVFDDSVKEFLRKREKLANYFDESLGEDIFDYIPPQKNNQIFTPKKVVRQMVDMLEEENPGCFDDPTHTFADLYMKSGLYITEIVKRLYGSPKMKELIPDDGERVRHILRHQVYGMAPTQIIYRIAVNYILGFDKTLKEESLNFVCTDASEAAKNGTLAELVEEKFGVGASKSAQRL